MARDDDAHAHRGQRDRGVGDRFAFAQARRSRRQRDDVGADALLGDRKRRERARAGFEEQVDDADVAQQIARGGSS
jgi:hypothetical protein